MKHTKWIAGLIGIALGLVITFVIPTPHGLTHAGMIVLGLVSYCQYFLDF